MNSEKTDFNKIELIRKLEILRELEMKKPINEIDTDFIDEIVLFGLELKGLNGRELLKDYNVASVIQYDGK